MVQIKFSEDFNEQPAPSRSFGLGGRGGKRRQPHDRGGALPRGVHRRQHRFPGASPEPRAVRLQLGERITKGLGVGGNPVLGRQATEESRDRIGKL
jgi:hypothetical protein